MIEIRAPRPEDVGPLTAATNLPGVRAGTLRLPFTPEAVMTRRLLEPGPNAHPLVAARDGVAVGQGSLLVRQGRQRHVGDLFLFVHDDHWGQGVGRALLGALLGLADDWLGLVRLELQVAEGNGRARRLYEAAGFEVEGRLRADILTEGRLVDSLLMGRLRPAPAPEGRT